MLGAKEQLANLIAEVVSASGLPPALKTQLIAKLKGLAAGFDPANAKQKQAVCVALNVFRGCVASPVRSRNPTGAGCRVDRGREPDPGGPRLLTHELTTGEETPR